MKPPQRVTLRGRSARLEPLAESHREDLLMAAAEDPATFRYMGADLSIGPDAWASYLADALRPEFVTWATIEVATGRAVGSTRFGDIAPEHGRVEIGWTWLAPSRQRSALNTEVKLLQLGYAFDELGATRVALKTDGRNERSQRAIERIGGIREGILRRHMRMPDGYQRDTVYYAILSDAWPAARQRLQARLGIAARSGAERVQP